MSEKTCKVCSYIESRMSEKTCKVCWYIESSGKTGCTVPVDEATANQWARELNEKYKGDGITHYVLYLKSKQ